MPTDRGGQKQPTTEVEGPPDSRALWLANCHGFLVDDEAEQPIGVVDDVVLNHGGKHPCALVVVQGWGRRWLIVPVHAVTKITPAERRLTVVRPTGLDGWPQLGRHQPAWPPRGLLGALRALRRLIPGRH